MSYELEVTGGKNIERSIETFETLTEAIEAAEKMATGDTLGWRFRAGKLVLPDNNNSDRIEDTALHYVRPA